MNTLRFLAATWISILTRVFLSVCILLGTLQPLSGHKQPTNPPTAFEMQSLFENDPCAPPCWFGLVAGESTLEDVVQMFQQNPDVFFNDFNEVGRTQENLRIVEPILNIDELYEQEWIEFFWLGDTSTYPIQGLNFIALEDNAVSQMRIAMNRQLPLKQVLEQLGEPNTVRAANVWSESNLLLFYRKQKLVVELLADSATCQIENALDDFVAYLVFYLSTSTYPQVVLDWHAGSAYVPNQMWERWLAGEVTASCSDTIDELSS